MKPQFYTLFLAIAISIPSLKAQTKSAASTAFSQSVIGTGGTNGSSCGIFRTMESVRHGMVPKFNGVEVRVEQPVCPGQHGAISLVNPSGESWKYRVIEKTGNLLAEGDVGYDRRINKLPVNDYMIQFTTQDGSSFLDEFSITPGVGLTAVITNGTTIKTSVNTELNLTASCENANEFSWDFGDGTSAYGENSVNHRFTKPGIYTVTFTANNFDCTSSFTSTISVFGPMADSGSDEPK